MFAFVASGALYFLSRPRVRAAQQDDVKRDGSSGIDGGYTLRPYKNTDEELTAVSEVMRAAFNTFNAKAGLPIDYPTVVPAKALIKKTLESSQRIDAIVAVQRGANNTERIIGITIFDGADWPVNTVGPVAVDPGVQASGVGMAMMRQGLKRAQADGFTSIQLTQTSANTASLSVYAKLGFDIKQQIIDIRGFPTRLRQDDSLWDDVDSEDSEDSRSQQETVLTTLQQLATFKRGGIGYVDENTGFSVRYLTREDLNACDALSRYVSGFSRLQGIRAILDKPVMIPNLTPSLPYPALVVVDSSKQPRDKALPVNSKGERIVGFTAGFHMLGFTMAISDYVLRRLFVAYCVELATVYTNPVFVFNLPPSSTSKAAKGALLASPPGPLPAILLYGRAFPRTMQWLLDCGVRVNRQRTLMVKGDYPDIRIGTFYAPSLLY